ncbi:MAG: beta-glucosidase [Pseudomonas sp.]
MAGYECTTHRRSDGQRLDLLATTGHGTWPDKDYQQLGAMGIGCARDGLRWHLIESRPGRYDWSSFLPMLRAARDRNVQVVWDLCHYGYPDGLDIWRPGFVDRFARFAGAAAKLMKDEGVDVPFYSPINEISFWSWAGAQVGYFNPGARGRGQELKHQLVRANIAAIEAVRQQAPDARFVQCDPLINVIAGTLHAGEVEEAEHHRLAQFEAWDLLAGRQWPGLGGREDYLDIIGVNFYPHNQWFLNGGKILLGDRYYRPLVGMLSEIYQRYQRPLLVSETGAETEERAPWLNYISDQAALALERGVPVAGICWYPFLDYPGWDDDRHCSAGLFGYADSEGNRALCQSLHLQMKRLQARFTNIRESACSNGQRNDQ